MDALSNISPMIVVGVSGLVVIGILILYGLGVSRLRRRLQAEVQQAQQRVAEAEKQLETERREMKIATKEQLLKTRSQVEEEFKAQRVELENTKKRLERREDNLDKGKLEIEQQTRQLQTKEQQITERQMELAALINEQQAELERIAMMSRNEARDYLMQQVAEESRQECAQLIQRQERQAREDAERIARQIIAQAIQRCAVDHTTETTVSVVALPGDDMKGRIIGRNGRNIRAFEQLTGLDLIVDDTPEAVVLSGFDTVRREIARIALEHLVEDGRIHPGRIEEMVDKARRTTEEHIRELGEQAAFDTGVTGLHPEIIRLLGKLQFRTSFGQNVLKHSLEVSHLAGMMAAEIGARVAVARRAGLLHDLGKAVDFERDGPHALIGADIARTRGERPEIEHAIAAHHDDIEIESVEAALVQVADAISAARPGARREPLETYLKRLEGLEEIAIDFDGVDKVYAIQAGREIRVLVKPDQIDDLAAHQLAKLIAERVENEMDYPGQIRVTVIRETRTVEYAK